MDVLAVSIVAGLIGYSITRAVVADDVGEPIRRLFDELRKRDFNSRWRRLLCKLTHCQFCLGFWVCLVAGVVCSAVLLDVDWSADVVAGLAAGGLQRAIVALIEAIERTSEPAKEEDTAA